MYLWLGKIPSLIFFHLVHCRRAAQLSPGFRKCHGSVWRHVHDWINPSSPDRSAIVNLAIIVNTIQYIHPRWSQLLLCCLLGRMMSTTLMLSNTSMLSSTLVLSSSAQCSRCQLGCSDSQNFPCISGSCYRSISSEIRVWKSQKPIFLMVA